MGIQLKRTTDFSVTSLTTETQLTDKDWKLLNRLDSDYYIYDAVIKAGATDMDYNGHFGQVLILTAESHAEVSRLLTLFFSLIGKE